MSRKSIVYLRSVWFGSWNLTLHFPLQVAHNGGYLESPRKKWLELYLMTNLSLYDLDPGIGQVSLYITLHTLVSTMIVWYLKSKLVCRIVVSLLYRCTVSMLTSCDEKAKYDLRSSERKLKGLAAALTSCSSSKDLQLVSTNLRPKVFFFIFPTERSNY